MNDFVMDGGTSSRGVDALLRTIEGEVIPRLVLAHRQATKRMFVSCDDGLDHRPGDSEIERFCDMVVHDQHMTVLRYLQGLQTLGMSLETIYLDLLAPAARRFGRLWESEQMDFVEVTLGVRRLQNLAHDLAAGFADQPLEMARAGRRALFVVLPGEQHVFGTQLVTELLRRAAWDVWDAPGARADEIARLVKTEWFAIVGISISSESQIDALATLIRQLRRVSLNKHVRVMVGGQPFESRADRVTAVGADATASNGRDAVAQAESLLELWSQGS